MESLGHFWRPETPAKRFPGRLSFDPNKGGRLTVLISIDDGGLTHFNDPGMLFRCVGEAGGKLYTLEDCFLTNSNLTEQSLYVNRIIQGMHFEENEPFEFEGAVVGLDNFAHWLGLATIDEEWYSDAGSSDLIPVGSIKGIQLKVQTVEDISTAIPGGNLCIQHCWGVEGDRVLGRQLTQDFALKISLGQSRPLPELMDVLSDAQDLVTIGTGHAAAFDEVKLYHPDLFIERNGTRIPQTAELLVSWIAEPDEKKRTHDMVFSFEDLGGIAGVRAWMEVAARRREMLGTVMGTKYAKRMYSTDRFLHRTAALENLHREMLQGRRTKVALNTRLKELSDYAGEPFMSMLANANKWRQVIVKERNNIAHHLGRPAHVNQGAMVYLAESVYWLFVICLLREAGAPQLVFDNIEKNGTFGWARSNLRRMIA